MQCVKLALSTIGFSHFGLTLIGKQDLLTGIDFFVAIYHVQISILYHSCEEVKPAKNTRMNPTKKLDCSR